MLVLNDIKGSRIIKINIGSNEGNNIMHNILFFYRLTNFGFGLYVDEAPKVKMEVAGGVEIRYATDGSVSDRSSELYSRPFELAKSVVVTAKAFWGDQQESSVSSAYFRLVNKNSTFFIKPFHCILFVG